MEFSNIFKGVSLEYLIKDINLFVENRGLDKQLEKNFFVKYQQQLLYLANIYFGRRLFNIYRAEPITKITPNAVHFLLDNNTYELNAYCKTRFAKSLYGAFVCIPSNAISMMFYPTSKVAIALATGNYFAGAGDGRIEATSTSWSTARGATTGTVYDDSGGVITDHSVGRSSLGSPTYYNGRGFFPVDASSLNDTALLISGALNIYCDSYTVYNDNTTSWVLVQTSQASTSSLTGNDYDNLSFTSGGTLAFSTFSGDGYKSIPLDATGLTWVSRTAYSLLGVINSRDQANSAPTGFNQIGGNVYTSKNTGTSKDPYLSIVYTLVSKVSLVTKATTKKVAGVTIGTSSKIAGVIV